MYNRNCKSFDHDGRDNATDQRILQERLIEQTYETFSFSRFPGPGFFIVHGSCFLLFLPYSFFHIYFHILSLSTVVTAALKLAVKQ